MKDDDPVEELHRIRRQICKKAGGTPAAYVRYYLEMDREKVAADKAAETAPPPTKASARKPGARRKIKAVVV